METTHTLSQANTFEWAHVPEGKRVTFTMRLPDHEQCQNILQSITFEPEQHTEFCDIMLSDWKRGAVTTYFDRGVQMGRWVKRIIDAKLDEGLRLTCWAEVSSKLNTSVQILLNEQRSSNINDVIAGDSVYNHIMNTLRSCEGG